MKIINFLIIFLTTSVNISAQDLIWDKTQTVCIQPATNWINTSQGDSFAFSLKSSDPILPLIGHVTITKASALNWTLDELWTEYVDKDFPLLLKDYEKLEEGTSHIDNLESRWIIYHSSSNDIKFKMLTASTVKNNVLYIITCTSAPNFFDEVSEDFNKMINSIRIR